MNNLTPYQQEQLEIIRRTIDRGLKLAQDGNCKPEDFIDVFQHLLDELDRIKL